MIVRSFRGEGEHSVTVRVADLLDSTSEYTSRIIVASDEIVDEYLSVSAEVTAQRIDDEIVLSLDASDNLPPFLWVRMDGLDLGYVDSAQGSLTITDIDFNEDIVIEVAWLSEDAISEWREVGWNNEESEELNVELETSAEAPRTGVSFADGILSCFTVVICIVLVRKILWE